MQPRTPARAALLAVSLAVHAAGAWLGTEAILEIADENSRGSFVLRSLRSPAVAAAAGAVLLCVVGGVAQLTRARKHAVPPVVLLDLFVLGVAAIAIQVVGSNNYKVILFQLAFSICFGIFALLRWFDGWRTARRRGPVRFAELWLFRLCLTLVLLEVGLRITASLVSSPLLATDAETVQAAMNRFRYAPGERHWGFPVNEGSHNDEEFAPGPRATVAVVGDSFSFGIVPHYFHFTTVAERALPGVHVHNLGYPGIGPGAYLHLVETEVLALNPDLVVISLFLGNDLSEVSRWNSERGFLPSICDRRNVLSFLLPSRLLTLGSDAEFDIGRTTGDSFPPSVSIPGPEDLIEFMPWLTDPTVEKPLLSEEIYLRVESKRARLIHHADGFRGYELLFACLSRIREVLGPIPMAVQLIPDHFQVDEQLWSDVSERLAGYDLDRDLPQRRLRAWLTDQDIPFLDLLPVLRAQPLDPDGSRHLYHARDTHFNARGNRVAGEELAEFLEARLDG